MKDTQIKKEITKLNKIFEYIPDNKKKLVEGLIQNAAFMAVTLEELQADIQEKGAVFVSVNGNGFETVQENPAQKSYNTMIARYTATIKQLQDLLPDSKTDGAAKAGESLAAFIAKGKNVEVR